MFWFSVYCFSFFAFVSHVLRTCFVVFGLFDYFQNVFQLVCFGIVFGFIWVMVGFVWLLLVVLVAWILCFVFMLC